MLKVIEDTGGVFHPKVIVGLRGGKARALIGSSNFTTGGFSGNTEMNVLLEGPAQAPPLAEVLAFVGQQWTHPRAFEPDDEWLERYQRAYDARPRPKPLPKNGNGKRRQQLVKKETDLGVGWKGYYDLITQQERRTLSNGVEIHVFDHEDSSYLQEVEHCQELFRKHGKFEVMPPDDREFVAGFGMTSGYFGRMVGAGYYKNMVKERSAKIGRILDALPLRGRLTDDHALAYMKRALTIPGISLGTATRLAVAKRPDRFLSVNGASKPRIREVFGTAPTTADAYVDLLRRLWSMPWFTAPMPDNEHERRIWRVRVAILDAVMYDKK